MAKILIAIPTYYKHFHFIKKVLDSVNELIIPDGFSVDVVFFVDLDESGLKSVPEKMLNMDINIEMVDVEITLAQIRQIMKIDDEELKTRVERKLYGLTKDLV